MNLFSTFRSLRLWAAVALLPFVASAADQDIGDITRLGGANLFAKPFYSFGENYFTFSIVMVSPFRSPVTVTVSPAWLVILS